MELIVQQLGPKKTKIPRRQLSKLSISHIHFLSIMAKTILQASFFPSLFILFLKKNLCVFIVSIENCNI